MRIGHYTTDIWAEGGVAAYIRRVGDAQAKMGHELIYLDLAAFAARGHADSGVRYLATEADLLLESRKLALDVLHLHGESRIVPGKSDVFAVRSVHNHSPYCPSDTRYLQRWDRPCPRAYSISGCVCGHLIDRCGSLRPQKILDGFRKVRRERGLLARVPAIANSTFVREQMIRSGYDPQRISMLLLPGPDSADPSPLVKDATPRFLFLGRMVPEKGLRWLIESAALLKHPFHLDVAGDGRQRAAMEQLVIRLGLKTSVTFHGWVDQGAAFGLMGAARAVIFPSVWHEPAGLVTLEAAANSRAVIASAVGGIPEYGRALGNTILVPVADRPALAAAIDRLAADATSAAELGDTGRRRVQESFSLEQHVASLIDIYKNHGIKGTMA